MSEFTIAQLSDPHCGSPHFVPSLLDRALVEVNDLQPDVVIVSGDLTGDGLRGEYEEAREYLDRLECEKFVCIPGNHDSRNVGFVHFEDLFGDRSSVLHVDGVSFVAVDSTWTTMHAWGRFGGTVTTRARTSSTTALRIPTTSVGGTKANSRTPSTSAISAGARKISTPSTNPAAPTAKAAHSN